MATKAKKKFNENAKNMEMYEEYLPKDATEVKRERQASKKMKPVTYAIRSENGEQSVQDVIVEMRKASHTINSFFDKVCKSLPEDPKDQTLEKYISAIAAEMVSRTPKLYSKENLQTTFSMSVNKVSARLDAGVKFDIIATYVINHGVAEITATVGKITLFSPNNDLKAYLSNHDKWEKIKYM